MAMSKSKEAQYKRAEAASREPSRAEPQLVIHDRHSAASLALPVAVEAGHLECTDLLLKAGASAEAMAASLLLAVAGREYFSLCSGPRAKCAPRRRRAGGLV